MDLGRHLLGQGRWALKRIAEALGISRSHLSSHRKEPGSKRDKYDKDDAELLERIMKIVKSRPTYGYRRVTAILNRDARYDRVNHKRVYRVMRENGILLPKYTGKVHRHHTGQIITPRSNVRWCSDGFEIRCWNGEKVFVAFAMDCCDREVIAWVASSEHLNAESVRDLIALSVEQRFETHPARRACHQELTTQPAERDWPSNSRLETADFVPWITKNKSNST